MMATTSNLFRRRTTIRLRQLQRRYQGSQSSLSDQKKATSIVLVCEMLLKLVQLTQQQTIYFVVTMMDVVLWGHKICLQTMYLVVAIMDVVLRGHKICLQDRNWRNILKRKKSGFLGFWWPLNYYFGPPKIIILHAHATYRSPQCNLTLTYVDTDCIYNQYIRQ